MSDPRRDKKFDQADKAINKLRKSNEPGAQKRIGAWQKMMDKEASTPYNDYEKKLFSKGNKVLKDMGHKPKQKPGIEAKKIRGMSKALKKSHGSPNAAAKDPKVKKKVDGIYKKMLDDKGKNLEEGKKPMPKDRMTRQMSRHQDNINTRKYNNPKGVTPSLEDTKKNIRDVKRINTIGKNIYKDLEEGKKPLPKKKMMKKMMDINDNINRRNSSFSNRTDSSVEFENTKKNIKDSNRVARISHAMQHNESRSTESLSNKYGSVSNVAKDPMLDDKGKNLEESMWDEYMKMYENYGTGNAKRASFGGIQQKTSAAEAERLKAKPPEGKKPILDKPYKPVDANGVPKKGVTGQNIKGGMSDAKAAELRKKVAHLKSLKKESYMVMEKYNDLQKQAKAKNDLEKQAKLDKMATRGTPNEQKVAKKKLKGPSLPKFD